MEWLRTDGTAQARTLQRIFFDTFDPSAVADDYATIIWFAEWIAEHVVAPGISMAFKERK